MNRIYKVIWSKTKHCYVVVSELAKRHTKGGSTGGCRMMTARVLSTLLLGAYLVGGYSMPSAWAADIEADKITAGSITVGEVQVGSFLSILEDAGTGYSMAIGEGSNANAGNSVAILGGVTEAGATNSLAIGEGSVTNAANSVAMLGGTTSEGATNALAIGRGAQATLSDSIALGSGAVADRAKYDGTDNPYKAYLNEDDTKTNSAWRATHNAIAVGASEIDSNTATVTATVTRQLTGLAAGTEDTDAVNVAQLKAATVDLVNIQGITRDNNKTTIEQGFTVQTNFNSGSSNGYMNVYWGQNTLANGENATAWGKSTVARSPRSTAWGNEATAKGDQATAFGSRTTAYGVNSTAWGADTVAFSHQATAFGENATAGGQRATAWGHKTTAGGDSSTAYGKETSALMEGATAWGNNTKAGRWTYTDENGVVHDAVIKPEEINGIESGKFEIVDAVTGEQITNGQKDYIEARKWLAEHGTVNGVYSTAWGNGTQATGDYSTAFGNYTKTAAVTSLKYNGTEAKVVSEEVVVTDASGKIVYQKHPETGELTDEPLTETKYKIANAVNSNTNLIGDNTYFDTEDAAMKYLLQNATITGGYGATAFGLLSEAKGAHSTAFGVQTVAEGTGATAWGNSTTASGKGATASGYGTKAEGDYSTAFGNNTTTAAVTSLKYRDPDNNDWTEAKIITKNTATGLKYVIVEAADPNKELYFSYFDTEEAAMNEIAREGKITGGYGATAFGLQSEAKGSHSTAFGVQTVAEGTGATAWGRYAKATGDYSTAWGFNTEAINDKSTAFGDNTIAGGKIATAWGNKTAAGGRTSTAFGSETVALTEGATAWGNNTKAGKWTYAGHDVFIKKEGDGRYHIIDEYGNSGSNELPGQTFVSYDAAYEYISSQGTVKGVYATAWGNGTKATGDDSTAFGNGTKATGDDSTAFGLSTEALGYISTAFGSDTEASGTSATAWGSRTKAKGVSSTAFGSGTTASGVYSTAFGEGTLADGSHSTAWGAHTQALGYQSTAFGDHTTAGHDHATAWGYETTAGDRTTTAFGVNTAALMEGATAWGHNTKAGKWTVKDDTGKVHDLIIETYIDNNPTEGKRELWGVKYAENKGTDDVFIGGQTSYTSAYEALKGLEPTDPNVTITMQGNYATAWGNGTEAEGDYSTAFGNFTKTAAVTSSKYAGKEAKVETEEVAVLDEQGKPVLIYDPGDPSAPPIEETVTKYIIADADNKKLSDTYFDSEDAAMKELLLNGTITGGYGATAFGLLTEAKGAHSTAFGVRTKAEGIGATAWGNGAQATGDYSTAFGNGSVANASNSLAALGGTTAEDAANSLAVGLGAQTTLPDSIALGSGAVADRAKYDETNYTAYLGDDTGTTKTGSAWRATANAIAIGHIDTDDTKSVTRQIIGVAAGTEDTDAVNVAQLKAATFDMQGITRTETGTPGEAGYVATTTFENNLSVSSDGKVKWGNGTKAEGDYSTAGGFYTKANGDYATAFGRSTEANGDYATAFGRSTEANGYNSTAFGNAAKANGQYTTAFGSSTEASGDNSTAFGSSTKATGPSSTAFGRSTEANGYNSTAFGNYTQANGQDATAFGSSSTAAGKYSTAFGSGTQAGKLTYKKEDGSETEAKIVGYTTAAGDRKYKIVSLRNENDVLSNNNGEGFYYDDALKNSNLTKQGDYSTAFGSSTQALGDNSTAFGSDTMANGQNSTAFGSSTIALGDYSTAWGFSAQANGTYSTAFGNGSVANAYNSLAALGGTTGKKATNSVAIGTGATVGGAYVSENTETEGANAFAFGNGAQATLSDSVALGSEAVANRAKYNASNNAYKAYLNEDDSKTNSAWRATHNAIAVGASATDSDTAMVTRQITGVAAGTYDTDAVNVAQLKAATFNMQGITRTRSGNDNDGYTYTTTIEDKLSVSSNGAFSISGDKFTVDSDGAISAAGGISAAKGAGGYNFTVDSSDGSIRTNGNISAAGDISADNITVADGNYISAGTDVAGNLVSLDSQVKTNTDAIATKANTTNITVAADGNYISAGTGVADNLVSLDSQVKTNTDAITTTGITFTGDTGTSGAIKLNDTLAVNGDSNITTEASASTLTVKLNNSIDLGDAGSMKIGSATLGTSGLTIGGASLSATGLSVGDTAVTDTGLAIAGGPSVTATGIDAGGKRITGVLTGAADTDAVNVKQMNDAVFAAVTTGGAALSAGNGISITGSKLVVNAGEGLAFTADGALKVNAGEIAAENTGFVTGGAVHSALQAYQPDGEIAEGNAKAVSGGAVFNKLNEYAKVDGATLTNTALTGATLSGASMGSGNIADDVKLGAADSAITVGTLKTSVSDNTTAINSLKATVGDADSGLVKDVSALKATVGDTASGLVKKVADHADAIAANKEAIATNKTAIDDNAKAIKTNADNITSLGAKVSANETAIQTNATNIAANKTAIQKNADGIAANKTAIDDNVKAIKTNADNITSLGAKVSANETALSQKADKVELNEVKAVVGDAGSGLVKDVSDLKNASRNISSDDKGNTKVDGTLTVKTLNVNGTDVTEGLAAEGRVEENNRGYVDGDKVYDYLNSDTLALGANSNRITMGSGSEAGGDQSIAIGYGIKVHGKRSGAIGDPGDVFGDDSYVIGNNPNVNGNGTFVVGNDAVVAGDGNFVLGHAANVTGKNNIVLGSNVTATVDNAVVLGNKSTAEADAVSVGSAGGERQIKHVKAGQDDTDAVNVGQMNAAIDNAVGNNMVNMSNQINNLDSRINKVGAGAAALAALHPIDTDDKFTMGLGYGNYRSAHAMAMGMFYRPTEKIMISVGGAFGNGENMINAGISFALDKGKGFGTSKAAMARKIAAQDEIIAAQGEALEAQKKENAQQRDEIEALKEALARLEAKIGK